MYWPKCKLTPEEAAVLGSKYGNPKTGARGVLRRFYPGFLELTAQSRLPLFPFQIARRNKVFGITVCGDVEFFNIIIKTSSGETHNPDRCTFQDLVTGYNESLLGINSASGVVPTLFPGFAPCPYIIDPAIDLSPNEVLSFEGSQVRDAAQGDADLYRVDFTIHVWEYPEFAGSPS
jgi:hypothetical protein